MRQIYKNKERYRCDWCKKLLPLGKRPLPREEHHLHFCGMAHSMNYAEQRYQLGLFSVGQLTGAVIPVKTENEAA